MLNRRDTDVVEGTAFLTLRSDGNDKFAQPDGRFVAVRALRPASMRRPDPARGDQHRPRPARPSREVAFHPRAFREIHRFIAGTEPSTLAVPAEAQVRLSGLVTGNPGGVPTNRPVEGAKVTVFRVDPATAERRGEALLDITTAADGRWGPVTVAPTDALEFVLCRAGRARHPHLPLGLPALLQRRPSAPGPAADGRRPRRGAVVLMTRPRGYFGIPRDVVLLDGREPADVTKGVATDATTTLRLPAAEIGRPVAGLFNEERVVARAWSVAENRIARSPN